MKQRLDFQQTQWKQFLQLWLDLRKEKMFETTVGIQAIPVQKIVETMASICKQKKSLKQPLDFQQSQSEKLLNLWVDLGKEKSFKQRLDYQQFQCKHF